jgi:hypothetical protein
LSKREKAAPLLIGIDPNSEVDGKDACEIKSIYGRDNFIEWLIERSKDSKIVIGNKDKATALLLQAAKQYRGEVAYVDDLIEGILSQEQTDVKSKFSLDEPVEYTKDLIAVHNLTEENLMQSMEAGGLPSPSIAKTNRLHW